MTNQVRSGPSPNLSPARYMREMDKICAAPLTEYESARLAELRELARTVGIGGPARGEYAMLRCVETEQAYRSRKND